MNCVVEFLYLTTCLITLMNIVLLGDCKIYRPLLWSPLNPLFKTFDRNTSTYRINVLMFSKLNIICPNPTNNPVTLESQLLKEEMFENIWFVDEKSFKTCIVNTTNSKKNFVILKCNKPLELLYHLLVFLPTTNVQGHPEFKAGKDHYFIATSNGSHDSLGSTAMGHCSSKNMRLIIHVCKDQNDTSCKENGPDPYNNRADNNIPTNNKTTTQPPKNKKSEDPAAAAREAYCFISANERIWLILVGVLGFLVLMLIFCQVYLCYSRRKILQATNIDEKRSNLL